MPYHAPVADATAPALYARIAVIGSVTCVCVAAGIAMRASATAAGRSTIASPRENPDPGSAGGRARNRRITPQAAGGHRNSDSSCSSSENNYGNSNILTSREQGSASGHDHANGPSRRHRKRPRADDGADDAADDAGEDADFQRALQEDALTQAVLRMQTFNDAPQTADGAAALGPRPPNTRPPTWMIKSGKGVKGHGKDKSGKGGVKSHGEGRTLGALARIGKAQKGAQGGDAADGADAVDGADVAAGHRVQVTPPVPAPTLPSLWPSCAAVTPPVPAPQPHTPPEALAGTLTVSAPEPRTTSVPSSEPQTPPEALARKPQYELPRAKTAPFAKNAPFAKTAPSALAPGASAKLQMTSSSSSSDSESEKEEEAKPAPAPEPLEVPTPTFMAHRRRPNADACADPGALPVADGAAGEVKHEVKEEERDDEGSLNGEPWKEEEEEDNPVVFREKNDFKDEVNDKDQTPRIETKKVKQEVAVIGAVPRRRSADPVLPAPSQRQARRPPRLPEDAPQFGDAKLLEDLEAEVKQNKKISTQSEIKQIV